jgi:hypothetical protein
LLEFHLLYAKKVPTAITPWSPIFHHHPSSHLARLHHIGIIRRISGFYRYYRIRIGCAAIAACCHVTENILIPAPSATAGPRRARSSALGQTICEVTEEMIVELHDFAEQTGRLDHQLARRLLNYLRANYTRSKIDDLGAPILRRDITSGANIEILRKLG